MAKSGQKHTAAEAKLLRYKQAKDRHALVMVKWSAKIRVQSEVVRSEKRKAERRVKKGVARVGRKPIYDNLCTQCCYTLAAGKTVAGPKSFLAFCANAMKKKGSAHVRKLIVRIKANWRRLELNKKKKAKEMRQPA